MGILLSMVMVLIGIGLLNYGSDWFVIGSSKIAKYFNVSNFVIGATVIAFGTSLPEIITSIYAVYTGSPMIAIGTSLGSCITNIGFVLGICAILSPIIIKHRSILKNSHIYLIYSIILTILGYDGFNIIDGFIMFILFLGYFGHTIKKGRRISVDEEINCENISLPLALLITIIGLLGVLIGSKLFVDGAKDVALLLGISDKIIGFTLVAFGTSLPEAVVSITAIRKKLGDIVIGNIIGSNMVNIGCALALSSMISYIPPTNFELFINLLLVTIMVGYMSKGVIFNGVLSKIKNRPLKKDNNDSTTSDSVGVSHNKYLKINRIEGLSLLIIYLIYVLIVTNII